MLNKLCSNLIKTGLGCLVCFNGIHTLTQKSQAATLSLFPETIDNLTIEEITTPSFIDADLLSLLIPPQTGTANINDSVAPETIIGAMSEPENISLESIISSFRDIRLDTDRENKTIEDIPVLPQVSAGDIYKDIYDFGTTAAQELSDPIRVGALPLLEVPLTPSGGATTTRTGVVGTTSPNLQQPSLPRFGGPVPIIGGPSRNFVTPLRQVGLPTAAPVQAGSWADTQVDVFFASLPKQEVVDIDTFMRTVYRRNISDMIKQIDSTLDLTIDANFNSMPAEVFPRNPMPSGNLNRTL